ncbi:MAG: type IV secretory system conjugative DNA transfer family protein [Bacteroidetes bacterium]|nr:type IV secretory system conjugative DNA transfer family protein [Bacteroidota bacterium]
MNIIISLITSIFELFEKLLRFTFEFLEASYSAIPKRNEGYNAQFASPGAILSRRETGFCLTGNRNQSKKLSFQNTIAIGGTGSGKSSVILLPSLYTMKDSIIVHDPSGELFNKSSGPIFFHKAMM